jgi:hypothetical protein
LAVRDAGSGEIGALIIPVAKRVNER